MKKLSGEKCDQKSPFHPPNADLMSGRGVGGGFVELWWFVTSDLITSKGPFVLGDSDTDF